LKWNLGICREEKEKLRSQPSKLSQYLMIHKYQVAPAQALFTRKILEILDNANRTQTHVTFNYGASLKAPVASNEY
jgi:hypothetical protein